MRLVDFLIALLTAHGQTLQRLAALFGEETLLEILEKAADESSAATAGGGKGGAKVVRPARLDLFEAGSAGSGSQSSQGSAYAALESSVHELQLPAILEFHLWAYPHYRAFIESPLDLNSRIVTRSRDPEDPGTVLIDEAVNQAREWIKKLPISPDAGKRAEAAAQVAWLRFRAEVLKRIGRKPLSAV